MVAYTWFMLVVCPYPYERDAHFWGREQGLRLDTNEALAGRSWTPATLSCMISKTTTNRVKKRSALGPRSCMNQCQGSLMSKSNWPSLWSKGICWSKQTNKQTKTNKQTTIQNIPCGPQEMEKELKVQSLRTLPRWFVKGMAGYQFLEIRPPRNRYHQNYYVFMYLNVRKFNRGS